MKQTRSFNFEIRAENSERYGDYITGRPIVLDEVTDLGDFTEEIRKGALDETDMKDVRFLVNHNIDMIPLARSRNNTENSTMQFTVDEFGMNIRVNLDTEENADARALYSAINRGDISGMSFMFDVDRNDEEWQDLESEKPHRIINRIRKIYEVSAVTFPAYEQTEINIEARSNRMVLDNAMRALDNAKRQAKMDDIMQRLIEARRKEI